jgi:hypothetical protein
MGKIRVEGGTPSVSAWPEDLAFCSFLRISLGLASDRIPGLLIPARFLFDSDIRSPLDWRGKGTCQKSSCGWSDRTPVSFFVVVYNAEKRAW